MKKLLIISVEFYPANFIGAQRAFSFAKYFRKNNWDVKVLSYSWGRDNSYRYGQNCYDPELLKRIDFPLITISGSKLNTKGRLSFLFYGRENKKLLNGLLYKSTEIINEEKVDLILTTAPPPVVMNVAKELKDKFNIPWIADLRDLPIQNIGIEHKTSFFSPIKRVFIKKQLFHIIKKANYITTVSAPLVRLLQSMKLKNTHIVYNGYDEEFFNQTSIEYKKGATLVILYAGQISKGRNPRLYLKGLDLLCDKLGYTPKIITEFYGLTREKVLSYYKEFRNHDLIKTYPRMSYVEIINKMKSADILLFLPNINSEGIMTGKIFEYLGANRPIISVPGDNNVTDKLINETRAGVVLKTSEEVAEFLDKAYLNWLNNKNIDFNPDVKKRIYYTREKQAIKLINIANQLTDNQTL